MYGSQPAGRLKARADKSMKLGPPTSSHRRPRRCSIVKSYMAVVYEVPISYRGELIEAKGKLNRVGLRKHGPRPEACSMLRAVLAR